MASLASFQKLLGPIVGMSELALYERQKALVRIGILPKPTGRGWASGGALATPLNVAWMLVSVLATDNLSQISTTAPQLGEAVMGPKTPRGPLEVGTTFVRAIAILLGDRNIAAEVEFIEGHRWSSVGIIKFKHDTRIGFVPPYPLRTDERCGFSVRSLLEGHSLVDLAKALEERADGHSP